ncbi:hypothetical protein H4218_000825 [Coemansia sp. IMI 209128]|nr:hypothetical protein H4218_000825 [Coemansia sp. IMI 209128]
MASSIGLRFSSQRAPLLLRPVAVRHYSQPRHDHFAINEYGLLSNGLPVPWRYRPSIFSRAGLEATKTQLVGKLKSVFALVTLKYHLAGWKAGAFATQAEVFSDTMNESFAEGDYKTLSSLCYPSMAASLKNDIKRRKTRLDWRKVRTVSSPRVVLMTCGRLSSVLTVGEVIVRIDQEQSAVPAATRNQALAKPVRVTEYVVFHRVISDPASPWRIFCKLGVPKWDPAYQK